MSDDRDKLPSLDDLDARLKSARGADGSETAAGGKINAGAASGAGQGFRIAIEMVAALGVGIAIGLLLDSWLGTKPWFFLLFFVLGAAAAFLNVLRTARELEAVRKAKKAAAESGGNEN